MPLLGKVLKQFVEARNELKIRPYQAARNQNNTLRKLLRKAEFTEFGREHGFTAILQSKKPEQLFSRNVPLSDYVSIYKNWWHRSVQGERDVCWPGQVKYFALSSGTSDSSSKRIPITKDMIHAIRNSSLKQILAMSNFNFDETSYEKGIMMLGGSTNLKRKGSYYEGDLSGISARNIPTWFQAFYKPGKKIAQLSDWERKLDEIAAHAHQWDIAHICGIPAWNQLMLERIIAHHRVKHIHEVWPNLTSFVHGGVAFEPYRKSFEKLLGKPITYIDTYLASEGFIAYQNRPDTHAMRLLTRNGIYFEFIPCDDAHFDAEGNRRNGVHALTHQEVN
ncbi:MAG: GH3 auxin-responsive promoter family protein, partial [Bacteroidota bacterium]